MGDRVIVYMEDRYGIAPGVYLHNHGSIAFDLLVEAVPHLRFGDAEYSAARFCGVMHNIIAGNTGIGLVLPPNSNESPGACSRGDGGVLVYVVATGDVNAYNGYYASKGGFPKNIGVPPK